MSHYSRNFLACSLLSVLLTACGGGGGDANPTDSEPSSTDNTQVDTSLSVNELKSSIRRMDLTGAQGFVITGSNTTSGTTAIRYKDGNIKNRSAVNMDPSSLYKVSSSGTLERVAVRDSSNEEIDRGLVQPFGLLEVNANYLFMWFRIQSTNVDDPLNSSDPVPYLVHKKTGLAYKAEGVIWQTVAQCGDAESGCETIDKQYKKIRSDNKGNIYIGHNDNVYKVDTSNLGGTSISAQAVQTQYSIHSSHWEVDDTGSILLFNGFDSDNSSVDISINLSDGSLMRVGQVMSGALANYNTMEAIFRGLDGNLYIVGYNASDMTTAYLFQASQDQSENLVLSVKSNLGSNAPFLWGNHHRQVINGKLIYFNANIESTGSTYMGEIFEFDYESGIFHSHSTPAAQFKSGAESIKNVSVSNGYMYFLGSDKSTTVDTIYRYDPATQSGNLFPTDVSSPINDFDIGNIKVLGNNKIWFDAFRFSDSITVIGEMDMEAGTIDIIDTVEVTEPTIIVMESIHPADFIVVDGSYQDWSTDLRTGTDSSDDGAPGHELTFFSYQQTATQFFGLIEFDADVINTANAGTAITVDGIYNIVIQHNDSFITDLSTGAETNFIDAGALKATGQALEFSVPLDAVAGIGSTPVVTVRRYSLENIVASDSYSSPDHTVSLTLPRALATGDDVIIQLVGSYELEITPSATVLVNTSSSTETDLSSATSGLGTANIEVIVNDAMIESPNVTLSPDSQDQLDVEQDEM